MNDNLEEFCKRHRVYAINTQKVCQKTIPIRARVYDGLSFFDIETEPLCSMEIPLSELEKIAEFESVVCNSMRSQGSFGIYEMMMKEKEQEQYLRSKYPSVKKAYDQYQLILKLVESGKE